MYCILQFNFILQHLSFTFKTNETSEWILKGCKIVHKCNLINFELFHTVESGCYLSTTACTMLSRLPIYKLWFFCYGCYRAHRIFIRPSTWQLSLFFCFYQHKKKGGKEQWDKLWSKKAFVRTKEYVWCQNKDYNHI